MAIVGDITPVLKSERHSPGRPISLSRTVLMETGGKLPPGYIHLGVAKEIAPTLREFGIDPDPVIRAVGLNPCLFDDGANVISHAALGRLLRLSVARTNCPHFGLLVGRRATILSLALGHRLISAEPDAG